MIEVFILSNTYLLKSINTALVMTMLLFLINIFLDYDLSMTPTTFSFYVFFLSLVTNAFKSDKN